MEVKREIKFRAFDTLKSRMFEVYGLGKDFATEDTIDGVDDGNNAFMGLDFERLIIMQFTGLTDKNGIEIYEGDYLVDRYPIDDENLDAGYHESLLPVVWCENKLQWRIDASFVKDGSFPTSLIGYFGEHLEVKGNIYENKK